MSSTRSRRSVVHRQFYTCSPGASPLPTSSMENDVSGPALTPTSTVTDVSGPALTPTSTVTVVNDVSGPAQNPNNLALIIGLVVGLVGLLVIAVLMIIILLNVVLVRHRKPAAVTEQPFYEYVTSAQPSVQRERIQLQENEAYGKFLSETSQPQVSIPPLQPNIAYGVIKTHRDLKDEADTPEPQEYEIPL